MRSVLSIILIYSLAITSVFAQSVNPNDNLKIGNKSSSSDKGITFDTNDGVNNKKLLVEKISKKLKWDGNSVQIGDGSSSSDKELVIAGALKSLKYNGTTGEFEFNDDLKLSGELKSDILRAINTEVAVKSLLRAEQGIKVGTGSNEIRVNAGNLEFSNDGTLFKKFGTGTGNGGSSGISILENASFEDGITTGWTSSGGTFSQETYTNSVEGSTKYARFVATAAAQYFETTLKAIPDNFSGGCQADFKKVNVSTDDLFKIEVLDSSSNVLTFGNVKKSAWVKFPTINFPCPTAGSTVKLRLTSLAAGTIEVDDAYLGSNQNTVNVGLSEVGEVITSASSCPDGTILADGSAVSRTGIYFALFNKIGITHGQGNGSTTFNLPDYRGRFLRGVDGAAGNDPDKASRTAMNTGGNTGNNVGSVQGDQFASHTHTDRWISVGGAGSTGYGGQTGTIGALASGATGGNETRPKNAYVNYCIRYTSTTSDLAVSPEQASWHIDANIGGGNVDMGTGTNYSSYTELTNGSLDLVINSSKGSSSAEIACQNGNASTGLTCSVGSESVGIAFVPPYSGLFEACFTVAPVVSGGGGATTVWQVIETPNNSTSILQEGGERVTKSYVIGTQDASPSSTVCGTFNFSDTSKKTLRLMREQAIAGTPSSHVLYADRSASLGQRDIKVTVRPLLSAYNRPVLVGGSPSVPGISTTRIETFAVSYGTTNATTACSASPCSYVDQIGNAVSSVLRVSAGDYTINTTKTYLKLKCTGSATATDWVFVSGGQMNCSNCSSVKFYTALESTTAGTETPTDSYGTISCIGEL